MKTKINISDLEANALKTIRENNEELFIRTIEMCIDMINNEANKYEKLLASNEGRTIRLNSTGMKYWRMTDKVSSITKKANLLWAISEKLHKAIYNKREEVL